MRFGSVCSGIEAASVAWEPMGWKASFLSDIEPFPCSVLKHRFPEVPLHGDFTTIKKGQYDAIDVLVGGTPCQSFSMSGLRKGLDDPRGNLMLGYLALADKYRPDWLVWENVPGVLSCNGGRDFGAFLGGLGQLGYGFAYRVLDAQYFGVPQRRRRVFVVGCLGDWRRAAAVLFERQSLQKSVAPRGDEEKDASFGIVGGIDCENNGWRPGQPAGPLMKGSPSGGGKPLPAVFMNGELRRLTPIEHERLQGFPDNWTSVPHRGQPARNSHRYRALGNSMAVPVMSWIGRRIQAETGRQQQKAAA